MILYEWKKLWKNASVLKIVLLFLVLSGVIFWGELNQDKEAHPIYLNFHKELDQMTGKEAENWFREEKQKEGAGYGRYKALSYLEEEISAVNGYEAYRESIQSRYQQSQSISVFAKDKGQNQYMERIAQKYKELEISAPMELQPYQGLLKVFDYYVHDILAVVLLIYLVSVVFIQEQRNGKADFARTMSRGGVPLFCAKACTVYGAMLFYLFGTFLIHMVLAGRVYGFISLDAAIQSVPGFYSVPYAWNIGTYIAAYGGLQGAAAFFLTAVSIFLARWFGSEIKTAAGLAFIMGWSVWSQSVMNGDGIEAVFRIWNVWGAFRGESVIKDYEILRFGNILIEQNLGIPICIAVGILLLTAGGRHCSKERKKKREWNRKKKRRPHGLLYYEMKKLWFYQGGIFLFAACIWIQAAAVYQYNPHIGTDEFYYQKYIDEFGNRITAETDSKIAAERLRLERLEEELYQTEDAAKSDKLIYELERQGGFQKYTERTEMLRKDEKPPVLLKDAQYDLLFSNTDVSQMMVILLCVSFAFLIPAAYQKEKETGMEVLQNTSWSGGEKLRRLKIGTILSYGIPFLLFSAAMIWIKEKKTYDLEWGVPVGCLPQYWENSAEMSIGAAFAAGILIQCLAAFAAVLFLAVCAKRVKNQHMLTGIILGITAVPTILSSYLPIEGLRWIHDLFFVFTADLKTEAAFCVGLVIMAYLTGKKERKE